MEDFLSETQEILISQIGGGFIDMIASKLWSRGLINNEELQDVRVLRTG